MTVAELQTNLNETGSRAASQLLKGTLCPIQFPSLSESFTKTVAGRPDLCPDLCLDHDSTLNIIIRLRPCPMAPGAKWSDCANLVFEQRSHDFIIEGF